MKYIFISGGRSTTFASIMNNHLKSPIIDLQQQQLLLRIKYGHGKEEFRRQTETTGVARETKRGLCWYPASPGQSYYSSLNQLMIGITRTESKETEHSFEFGRPVCFFRQSFDGRVNYMNLIAAVSHADDERMVTMFPSVGTLPELQAEEVLGVQLYFDETSYRAMFEMLEGAIHARGDHLAELRDTLSGTQKPRFRGLYSVRFPRLNSTQETAVNKVLYTRGVAIAHGPPGTGEIATLVEAIYETLHREPRVLVCTQNNTVVNWIYEKLVDRGVPVFRIDNPMRVNDKMPSSTRERRFENYPNYLELWGIRKSIREMGGRMRRGSYSEREGMRSRMSRLHNRATELEILIDAGLFDSARMITPTLVSSNHRLFNERRFPTLFIDEAAQALKAVCWIAIRKADHVILAGDHRQPPPTIKCIETTRDGLDHTLMERVVQQRPSAVPLLEVQYRVHEAIMRFPSEWFYNGELEAAPEVHNRDILNFDAPMDWIDASEMDFHEEFVGESFKCISKQGANLLLRELEAYIGRADKTYILDESINFDLISPYKAQVQYLRSKIKGSSSLRPLRSLITVSTVDGLQGQGRDVVFISLVRASENGQIGFLNDLRRMNVAVTRTRMKLVILGGVTTLTKRVFYRKLIQCIRQEAVSS